MPEGMPKLLCAPDGDYRNTLLDTVRRANRVVLVTAFATAGGVEDFRSALEAVLERPDGQVELVIAVDRQGFNSAPVFEALQQLQQRHPQRFQVGLVAGAGLLHAKALYARGEFGERLIVGSANLTRAAQSHNHELALLLERVPREIALSFRQFVNKLDRRQLTPDIIALELERTGLRSRPAADRGLSPLKDRPRSSLFEWLAEQVKLPPLPVEPETLVLRWIERGFLVGRGSSVSDALVIRLPLDAMERRDLVAPVRKRSLGSSAKESATLSYHLELLPADEIEAVRTASRRVSAVRTQLTLKLPCFGAWMPDTYWDAFQTMRERLVQDSALDPARIHAGAAAQRVQLLEHGELERCIEVILTTMREQQVIAAERIGEARAFLLEDLRLRVERRTPELIANAIQFRTARQRWAPFEADGQPLRQLMYDIVYAVLHSTYRSGRWPRGQRSLAARDLAGAFERAVMETSGHPDGGAALELLEIASSWESPERSLVEVLEEFRRLVPEDHIFHPPDVDELNEEET